MSEEGEEKGRGFKVEDRRRFSSEGEPKSEHGAEPEPEEPAAAAQAGPHTEAHAAHESASGAHPAHPHPAAHHGPEHAEHPEHPEHAEDFEAGEITFASFVVGLSTEALAFLGEMPNPATGEQAADLDAAQQIIDILGILREKTRGNLNRDEEGLIDAILFELRMKYVEKARAPLR